MDTDETEYERMVYNELKSGVSRPINKVIHPLNFYPSNTFPAYETNPAVPGIGDNCNEKIECQLYYEPTWDFYLKASFTCAEIVAKQPCFGTFACTCDNQYKSISANMPKNDDVNASDDDDSGLETWLLIVIICSGVVLLIGIVVLLICCRKKSK